MRNTATEALHPDLARYANEIRTNLADFEALCAGLTNAQFNWRSEPGRWSIAQCLAHLNVVNSQDLAPMADAIATAKQHHPGPYRYAWIWRYFINSMEPPVKTKFKVPKSYEPPPESDLKETLEGFRRISNTLLALIPQANGLDLARVKTPLPAIKFLKMPLGARLALLTAHNRRHLAQARAVGQAFPPA
ncbi:MAG: DinB family protein [Bryobacteraceae bacterium]